MKCFFFSGLKEKRPTKTEKIPKRLFNWYIMHRFQFICIFRRTPFSSVDAKVSSKVASLFWLVSVFCLFSFLTHKLEQNLIFQKAIYLDSFFVVAAIMEQEQIVNKIDESEKENICLCIAINHRRKNLWIWFTNSRNGPFQWRRKRKHILETSP